jgi:diguanylate cyclase (GGDEF)-like protein/PAS domain S-box-containing protein
MTLKPSKPKIKTTKTKKTTSLRNRAESIHAKLEKSFENSSATTTYLNSFINAVADPIFVKDRRHRWVFLNNAYCALKGHSRDELLGKTVYDIDPKNQADVMWQDDELVFNTGKEHVREGERTDSEGIVHITVTKKTLFKNKKGEDFIVGVVRDITERKRIEVALQVSERRLKLAAASGRLGIWDRDSESGKQIWDDRMYEIYGVAKDSFPTTFEAWEKCLHPDDRERVIKESQAAVRGEKEYDTEFRILHPDGSLKYIKARGLVIRDTEGKLIRAIGINWDITEQKNLEENLRNLSLTDDLTGLYNRRGFFMMGEPLLKLAKRYQMSVFLLYADMDKFKEINDVLGHKEGDQAIIDTANIFKATFRETDIVARIGGDEFVVIFMTGKREDADIVTARFKEHVMAHNKKNHRAYKLSISTGMSCWDPRDTRSIDDLLNQAEKLMYEEKMLKQKTD